MNRSLILACFLCLLFSINLKAQNLSIVPKPESIEMGDGHLVLKKGSNIAAWSDDTRKSATIFNDLLQAKAGFRLPIIIANAQNEAAIVLEEIQDPENAEGYSMQIDSKQVIIKGSTKGIFYGLQSLFQLIEINGGQVTVPQLKIVDTPAFGYRGIMLDVSRHFSSTDQIKKIIDLMGQLKLNTLHWHLTDDQGWRIEIKKYPKLTQVSSWRDSTIIGQYYDFKPFIYDGKAHGGYYTQEEAKEIVKYAADRKITVIPEIELPGHSSAILAAYPELGSFDVYEGIGTGSIAAVNEDGKAYDNDINQNVPGYWGVHYNIFGPTPQAFTFLEDVLTEIMEIFPSEYLHIGGDEVPKDHWKTSEIAQNVIKKENLADEHELQSHFIHQIELFLNKNNRKLIGWDEILEGGLAPNATVMSWRGEKGGIQAAKMGHDVIMTPNSHMYFDHSQGADKTTEPLAIGGFLNLEKVYSYYPIPGELTNEESKHVLGVQANLWTEYIPTNNKLEYFLFPRAFALAEVAWTKRENKDFNSFSLERLPKRLLSLEENNVFFRIPEAIVAIRTDETSGRYLVEIHPMVDNASVFYTFDGHKADQTATHYNGPVLAPIVGKDQGPLTLRYVTITPGGRSSNEFSLTVE